MTSKLTILTQHREAEDGPHYISVQSMVNYEVSKGITAVKLKGQLPSGCRTLLRLHRAMEFIIELFRKLSNMDCNDTMGTVTANAYNTTLSQHHTWVIRTAVKVAVYAMPSKEDVLKKIGKSTENTDETVTLLLDIISTLQPIYDQIQALYKENELLGLP